MMTAQSPFILLDDLRDDGAGTRLYRDPIEIIRADSLDAVAPALARLRTAQQQGHHAAGYLRYDASPVFEPRAKAQLAPGPLLWFGLFDGYTQIEPSEFLPDPAGAWAGTPRPNISQSEYLAQFQTVKEMIAAGDIYQANLTFRATVLIAGAPEALYALIRERARGGYGALVCTGADWLLSFSPELFFALEGGELEARPMKGTALRNADPALDQANADELAADPKQRAENLMIVDLMRNDLTRVAKPGSVRVPKLFEVERYPTVHQMVSSVRATLADGKDAIDALQVLFPCGSITGAPKLRAMEIIDQVEHDSRAAYTGSIGVLDPNGDAVFNVAIRTLSIDATGVASLGLGSGVVADSEGYAEWDECLAKGAFVSSGEPPFDLIETMRFDPAEGVPLLERHLERMKRSAATFGYSFDRHAVRNELQAATFRLRDTARVRLLLGPSGAISIGIAPLPAMPEGPVSAVILPLGVSASDFRLQHKTSRRSFYMRDPDAFETLYVDGEGYLTEGSFTSIFVERDGKLLTPPLSRGILPGVLRAELLETGRAVEADLRPEDLAGGFFLGNALRGLFAASTIAYSAPAKL